MFSIFWTFTCFFAHMFPNFFIVFYFARLVQTCLQNVSESCMIRLHFPWKQTSACMIPPSTHSPTTTFRVLADNKWTICSSKSQSWHLSFFLSFFFSLSLSLCPFFGFLHKPPTRIHHNSAAAFAHYLKK